MARFTTLTALNVNDAIPDAWVDEVKAAHDYLIVPGADLVSAATINPTSVFHKVTGSVTLDNITDLLGANAGQQVRLWFTGAPLVRNNGGGTGNIRTNTGSNLQIVANDIVTFTYDGSVWRETKPIGNLPVLSASRSTKTVTGSASQIHAGFAAAITPLVTGRLLICIDGQINNNGTNNTSSAPVQVRFGTGTAPVNGAAATGTQAGGDHPYTQRNDDGQFAVMRLAAGLTLGTAYWVDVTTFAGASGAISFTTNEFSIIEF